MMFRGPLAVFWLCAGVASALIAGDETPPPNIVFVLADDLGWSELGCYGNDFHETPHLDRLAADGVRFTQSYAAAPVCSPYRAALLTGQHPARIGIVDYLRPNSANALSPELVTLPEQLRDNGYATGMIGKWHLTGYRFHDAEKERRPTDHGFLWNIGSEVKGVGNGANFWPYVFRTQPIRWLDLPNNRLGDQEYLTDRLNLEAVEFIDRHQDQPFFLLLSHYAPHTILNGRPDLVEKYTRKHPPGKSTRERCYLCQDRGLGGDPLHHWAGDHNPHLAAMLESIDSGVGMIRAKLKEHGLSENTIVIFSSDNGGETNVTSNAPLRGGKSELYEGGIRVPMIVSWPAMMPRNEVCDAPTSNIDFYPTLLAATGVKPPSNQPIDGHSRLATWQEPDQADAQPLYWHYPLDRPHFLCGVSAGAIRDGDWKLIEFFDTERVELYSLAEDPSERTDLTPQYPIKAAALQKELVDWRTSIEARLPSPPLIASPKQLIFADHFSGEASSRWAFNKDWIVSDGILKRVDGGKGNTRLFLKDAEFADVVIRVDFRLGDARDVRLMTGAGGPYNAVIHLRPDHFFIQTAKDASGPYFSFRHGECAFQFDPERWYTMTVEFLGDELVAHLDSKHLAYAKHPILNKTRTYFAFQVDQHSADLDNVQIFSANRARDDQRGRKQVQSQNGAYPVEKSLAEQLAIQKANAHEWYYQRSEEYAGLVKRVDELDAINAEQFPKVFRSHKQIHKAVAAKRKQLLQSDPEYKEKLFATYRAKRAMDSFLVSQRPDFEALPESQRPHEIETLRQRFRDDNEYRGLVQARDEAQRALRSAYPDLFVSDEDINATRREERERLKNDPDFRSRIQRRAEAWRAQQDFLFRHDKRLAELQSQIKQAGR
ncbi:MAG: sulfatase-like hydrolase/transferase [Planctomycetota bacterium]